MVTKEFIDQLTYRIIGCAIEVHKVLGPGLLENVYQKCLIHELSLKGFDVKSQCSIPVNYKGIEVNCDLHFNLLVESYCC